MAEPFPFESMKLFAPISAAPDDATKARDLRRPRRSGPRSARRWPAAQAGRSAAAGSAPSCRGSRPTPPRGHQRGRAGAARAGVDPSDLVLDLALESDLGARFRMAVLNFDEDEVEMLLTDPHTMLGPLRRRGPRQPAVRLRASPPTCCRAGCASARPSPSRTRCASSPPSRPRSSASPTGACWPSGGPADVVVFDPDTVGCSDLRRVHDQPAGADRLVADAIGIDAVMVNGVVDPPRRCRRGRPGRSAPRPPAAQRLGR